MNLEVARLPYHATAGAGFADMNPQDIAAIAQLVATEFPACDVLINNAGIMRNLNVNAQHALTEVTQEIDIALRGPIQMVKPFRHSSSNARKRSS